jgi:CMP-N-acetylneuraminic acid synthetase
VRWVALMPLRGGSKSIPRKNLLDVAGRPLFAWSLQAAVDSRVFDEVVVASDDAAIRAAVSAAFGAAVTVLDRSPENASDTASSESVMLEVLAQRPCDVLALVQATSPLTTAADFVAARGRFERDGLDSLLTAVRWKRFVWSDDARPLNYDPQARPRRQDFAGALVENGAFYFTRSNLLAAGGSRLGGRIGIHEMAAETLTEIDEPADLVEVARLLAARPHG